MSDDTLFREVDEEVRAERYKKLWQQYGVYVMAAAVGIILAVSGTKGWQYYKIKQAEAAGEQYLAAVSLIDAGQKKEADEALAGLAAESSTGFGVLARFRMAADLARNGRTSEALKAYDELAGSENVDPAMQNLARVRAALLAVDTETLAQIEGRMAGLDTADGAWRHSAREIIALSAYRNKDLARANGIYSELTVDATAPAGVRQRAQLMVAVISPKLAGTGDGTAPASGSGEQSGADQ